jgi:acyl-CoA thioester hydrolase
MTPLHTHRLMVQFRDCDPLGHVNNAVYLSYLEQARFLLWRAQLNFTAASASSPGRRGVGFILARVEIDFVSQARYGDELEVRIGLAAIGRASFTYEYLIVDAATERPVAKARSVQVRFDYDTQEPIVIEDHLKATLARPIASGEDGRGQRAEGKGPREDEG